jgi:hypothetical protein
MQEIWKLAPPKAVAQLLSHGRGDLRRLRLNQRNKFFKKRNIQRYKDHPILKQETV